MMPFALGSCTDPRTSSISRLRSSDTEELRRETARLYTRLFPAAGPAIVPVQPELWPDVFLRLRPLRINLYRDGLAISMKSRPGFEYGLHIVPVGGSDDLKSTPRTQFEKLQEGIFYFIQQR